MDKSVVGLDSPRGDTRVTSVAERHADVGVILAADESLDDAMVVATQLAASRGGRLCLMRYIDITGPREAHELAVQSAAARAQLADLRARCRALDPHLVVTDRLHVGTLDLLLEKLEPSIGMLVIGSLTDPAPNELLAKCALPISFVDPAAAFTPGDAKAG